MDRKISENERLLLNRLATVIEERDKLREFAMEFITADPAPVDWLFQLQRDKARSALGEDGISEMCIKWMIKNKYRK